MKARNTEVKISGGGTDFSAAFEPFFKSFKYSDSIQSEADTCELVLADTAHNLLQRGIIPAKGSELIINIVKNNWNSKILTEIAPTLNLPLGAFFFDNLIFQGPPTELHLKFTSVPLKKGVRGVNRNFAWENTTLNRIALDIAMRAGLQLFFDAPDIQVKRVEQKESDLSFLKQLCKNNGLNLKIADKKLIVFDAEKYENKSPVIVVAYDTEIIKHFNFEINSDDVYSDATINFLGNGIMDLLGGGDIFGGVLGELGGDLLNNFASNNDGGDVLNINEHISDFAEGERLRKARLHDKNKKELTVRFTFSGSFSFLAGNTFEVTGFSIFDGKYICDRTEHNISDGYTTNVTAHRVK